MLRRIIDPIRLPVALSLRFTRVVSLIVARSSRRWELLVEHALTEPAVLRGWDGAAAHSSDPPPVRAEPGPETTALLSEDELADWARMPFSSATARVSTLHGDELRVLLDYERSHGHRPRFVQLLERRIDESDREAG